MRVKLFVLGVLCAAGLTLAAPPALAAFGFITKWGSQGNGDGQFSYSLHNIAVNASGDVFVLDTGNTRVQSFDNNGALILNWGTSPYGTDPFTSTSRGLDVDSAGYVYVGDATRVRKYTPAGQYTGLAISSPSDGGLAVDGGGNIYAANAATRQIRKFNSAGTLQTSWGSQGSGPGQFEGIVDLATDGTGNVYVADSALQRITKFTSTGTFVTMWGSTGDGNSQFGSNGPWGLDVDSTGHVWVADRSNYRVQEFDNNGAFLRTIGSYGDGDGQFVYPLDVAVDANGNVFVDDTGHTRIQKFGEVPDPQPQPPPPTTTTTTTPPPPPPPAPTPKPTAFGTNGIVSAPSPKKCLSRRNFRIRIRKKAGISYETAIVFVNNKRAVTRKGARITAPIDLRGLPKGRYTVKITVVTSTGAIISGTRKYRTCTRKQLARRRGPL